MLRAVVLVSVTLCSLGNAAWGQSLEPGATPVARIEASAGNGLSGATVLIVRHAEKPDEGTGLTPAGEARAVAYVDYFRSFPFRGAMLHVDTLIAAADTEHSARSRLTLAPLGQALAAPVQQPCASEDVGALADWLRAGPANRTILVAWHHGRINRLVAALGADPRRFLLLGWWPASVYDWVIVLRFDANGTLLSTSSGLAKEKIAIAG